MGSSLRLPIGSGHPVLPDSAKAGIVRVPDMTIRIAQALVKAVKHSGWSHKEAAAAAGVDDAEFGKWLSGARRPHLDRLFALEPLRQPLILALADLVEDVEVVTEIRFRKGGGR